jgi:dolichol-phosphate mannosyltransferase
VTRLAVVVAAYDERDNVGPLLARLASTLDALADCSWEAIFVVEGEDGTREAIEAAAAGRTNVRVVYRRKPTGIGAAFRRGFALVGAEVDYVVTLDADLNHQPEEVPHLLARARECGCDLLVGSRFVRGGLVEGTPWWKRALSKAGNGLMRHLHGLTVADKTSGFRVYRAAALRELAFKSDGFAFLPELLIRAGAAGMTVVEEPIHFVYRRAGSSKMAILETSWSYVGLLRPLWLWQAWRRPRPSGAASRS